MLMLIPCFLLPMLAAFLLLCVLWPGPVRAQFALKLCLAVGGGLGLASCTWFVWLVGIGPAGWVYPLVESAFYLAVAVGCLVALRRRAADGLAIEAADRPAAGVIAWVLLVIGAVALVAQGATVALYTYAAPHGVGDAVYFWNQRARALYRGGEQWADAFSPLVQVPDYPLLVPGNVVRGWWYAGEEMLLVPAVVAFLFTVGTTTLLAAALAALRGLSQGALAGLALVGTSLFTYLGSAQVADVPLSFYLLATLILLMVRDTFAPGSGRLVAAAGLTAGLAAWTKNDGQLFIVCLIAARMLVVLSSRGGDALVREAGWFLAGLLPVALVVGSFKLTLAPTNYILAGQSWEATLDRLGAPERYQLIGIGLLRESLRVGGGVLIVLPLVLLLFGRRGGALSTAAAVASGALAVLMCAAFALNAYVLKRQGLPAPGAADLRTLGGPAMLLPLYLPLLGRTPAAVPRAAVAPVLLIVLLVLFRSPGSFGKDAD